MSEMNAHKVEARLTLASRLADLSRVWPWVDGLAVEHAIPADTLFAIHLCLEEALSNIIRHGYRGEPNHAIELSFTPNGRHGLTFTIEDNAPHFAQNQLVETRHAAKPANPTNPSDVPPGGHGLTLMRKFAGFLTWEPLPNGNRLIIAFPAASSNSDGSA